MKKTDSNNATEETKIINRKETRELEAGSKEERKRERSWRGKKKEGKQPKHKGIRKEAGTTATRKKKKKGSQKYTLGFHIVSFYTSYSLTYSVPITVRLQLYCR
jgi:hypothetical protein